MNSFEIELATVETLSSNINFCPYSVQVMDNLFVI